MIVLDTNVISALMHNEPEPAVVAWLDRQPADSVWITAVTAFEIRMGFELLPEGRRRERLELAFQLMLTEDLAGRVLPLDEAAAYEAGCLAAWRKREGRSIELRDAQIAGIVLARRGARLATRDTRHFADAGIELIDPWQAP